MSNIFSKHAVLDGVLVFSGNGIYVETDTLNIEVEYSINSIPTATVQVPLGRLLNNGIISSGYSLISDALYRIPAYIYVTIANTSSPLNTANISNGKYLLFSGYLTSVTYASQYGRTVLVAKFSHWLSDLNFSSTLSATSHPKNPKNTIYNPMLAFGSAGSGFMGVSPFILSQGYIDPAAAIANFWGMAISPFLNNLINTARIDADLFIFNLNDAQDYAGYVVRRALNSYVNSYLPIDIVNLGINGVEIASRMVDRLLGILDQRGNTNTYEALAQTTIWQKIIEFAGEFLFAIIPYPLYYSAVPLSLGLQNYYDPYRRGYTIEPHEILSAQLGLDPPDVPVRALGMYGGLPLLAGSALDNPEESRIPYIGGWYISTKNPGYGLVHIKSVPNYLSSPYEPSAYTRAAIGMEGTALRTGLARSPNSISTTARLQQIVASYGHLSALDKIAQYYYVFEQLKNRSLIVTCPFRGDIAPGSSINFILNNDTFIPSWADGGTLYGTVTSIRYNISSNERPTTQYTILGVRNFAEFANPDYTILRHPLYSTYWIGTHHLPRL